MAAPIRANEITSMGQQVEEVVSFLVGTMDTSAQAAVNSEVSNVKLVACQVNLDEIPAARRSPVFFLYQEQFLVSRPGKPYRQRFLQLAPAFDGRSVESLAFKPKDLPRWVGFCDRPLMERKVSWPDIGTPVCSVFLKKSGSAYWGRTPADGCPAQYKGAVRITNRVLLTAEGMETWDRGFDAAGKQVWGAGTESYKFKRTPQSTMR
ncbi:hypothetical protein BST81_22080 [Leptolyngbya sp. 'hensonii']|uniref:chromophore lyase CpcT/CpeT n=1 Tax=Leptolyngbya sp. 'hensonii' TaxID=1922337 RepID=UPI00094FD6D5|nr:chromophore lyase CpcT/CpeT [Leptolyngbya sp. 'hensonii']OLP16292.1 hypothetical protein BST81_22080 [Leptolyngbya sp. 'hensonii']